MEREQLLCELSELIVTECDRDVDPSTLDRDATLIGHDSLLELDSLDALQISLAVKKRYGLRIEGGRKGRAALQSLNALADHILAS